MIVVVRPFCSSYFEKGSLVIAGFHGRWARTSLSQEIFADRRALRGESGRRSDMQGVSCFLCQAESLDAQARHTSTL